MNTIDLWIRIKEEATPFEEGLGGILIERYILNQKSLSETLTYLLSTKLSDDLIDTITLFKQFEQILKSNPELEQSFQLDLQAAFEQDFASQYLFEVLLYSKGFQVLSAYRLANTIYMQGDRQLALWLKDRMSDIYSVDIHPNAKVGQPVVLDHAIGIVIGETVVIGNSVTLFHNVTLGSTGKFDGKRHPTIGNNVLIGTGAKVIGNVTISDNSVVKAGELVLENR